MSVSLLEHCLYINLTDRSDRLTHLLPQLKKMGICGERFSAIKTTSGAVGCTMSHLKCLKIAKERNYPHVFICEDDITFLNPTLLKENLQKFVNYNIHWDVIILGGNNCPPYQCIGDFSIKVSNCQTTTGYIVNHHYYDTLISNFNESVRNLLNNTENKREFAIDMHWKKLQQRDFWFMIVPPTVTQYEDYSDIEGKCVNYTYLMTDLDKKWLFNRDLNQQKQKTSAPTFHNMTYYNGH